MSDQIIDRIDLPDETGSIVLYDWMSEAMTDGRNLVRIDPKGQWDGQTITANTWSCYRVDVDVQNGGVTVLAFTK